MRRGRRIRGPLVHIAHRNNDLDTTRVGYSVSRRVGSAVTRNRVKRRLRELVARHQLAPGHDIVLVAQPPVVDASFHDLERELLTSLQSAGLEHSPPDVNDDQYRPSGPVEALPAPARPRTPPGAGARLVLALIRGYQRLISPTQPAACRYEPTCSAYAATAVERFGAARGAWLAARRLLRCRPGSAGGYDPVPDPHPRGGAA